MPVTNWDELPVKVPFPGVEVGLVSGKHCMISYIHAKGGKSTRRHHHEAEQIFCLISGSARVQCGDEPVAVLKPGDVWYVPPHIETSGGISGRHGCISNIRRNIWKTRLPSRLAGRYVRIISQATCTRGRDTHFVEQRDLAADMEREQNE